MHQSKETRIPRTPGYVGLYHHIGSSLTPQCEGDSRILSLLSCGASCGIFSKMATIVPARTCGYLSAHWS